MGTVLVPVRCKQEGEIARPWKSLILLGGDLSEAKLETESIKKESLLLQQLV